MTTPQNPQDDHDHDHDKGLAFDLKTLMSRRGAVALLGLAGVGAALAYVKLGGMPGGAEANVTAAGADGAVCVKDPVETNGPFPGDGTNKLNGQTVNVLTETGIQRGDIRPSFGNMTVVADGVPLDLVIRVVDVGAACAPLAGHAVYIWHCNAEGKYSLYDLPDSNALRGVGITDAKGEVRFTSIVPGCYDGRWPHIHFEVFADAAHAVSGADSLLISQFAMPQAAVSGVYDTSALYTASIANLAAASLAGDNVFGDNTAEQIAMQTPVMTGDAVAGFAASVVVGIKV